MIERILSAIREAQTAGRLVDVAGLDGFSGDCLIGCLQRLAALNESSGSCYVEIGVFRGLTLVSVSRAAPAVATFGIDNFSQLDPRNENKGVVLAHAATNGLLNLHLVDADFEAALADLRMHIGSRQVGTYFVDGPHDYRSQLLCLELMKPHLSDRAAIVVDDSNYLHVRQANRDFLVLNPEFRLLFEAYTPCHPENMTNGQLREARAGWWNGVNVIVRDVDGQLERSFPPVDADRRIFLNDHIVHSCGVAANSNRAGEIVTNLSRARIGRAMVAFAKFAGERRRVPERLKGRFSKLNTYSEELPRAIFSGRLKAEAE